MKNQIAFDKDEARRRFYKENPQFGRQSKYRKITEEEIIKIIELYPVESNLVISEMLNIPYQKMSQIIPRLKKKGLIGDKLHYKKWEEYLDETIDKVKNHFPSSAKKNV